jgi:urea carboxylase
MSLRNVLLSGSGIRARNDVDTLQKLGFRVIVTYHETERHACHVQAADKAICIGGGGSLLPRMRAEAILDAARISGADAIFPGDDELAQNADFAEAVRRVGLVFVGPAASHIRSFRSRHAWSQVKHAGDFSVPGPRLGRRISIVVFGNGRGDVTVLGSRECTLSINGEFLFTESPVVALDRDLERALWDTSLDLGRRIAYVSVGSFDFLCDDVTGNFSVVGGQPRLTSDDRVIEAQTGLCLVEYMMRAAAGTLREMPVVASPPSWRAIQAWVRAEDPVRGFRPSLGVVTHLSLPSGCRVDTTLRRGEPVTPSNDALVATVVTQAPERTAAVEALGAALVDLRIEGIETNLRLLRGSAALARPRGAEVPHLALQELALRSNTVEVSAPGTFSILVDHPGRLGYWQVGIPPSGPMDDYSHRLANRIVGNASSCTCLEMTLTGPSLSFSSDTVVALTGARMRATLDGQDVEYYRSLSIKAGQVLELGCIEGRGARTYLAIRGGFEVEPYLGSRSTFTLGGFGGHSGRALRARDVLHVAKASPEHDPTEIEWRRELNSDAVWKIGVLYGPHAAPEFLTSADVEVLFGSDYIVHFNSNRTGIRLIGPKPEWARADGGEAGLHPSNIHDVPYALGAIDFTGDMPILLGPDGPSLGGFVCPAVVIASERWKLGQLCPGDRVRFVPVSDETALALAQSREESIRTLSCSANTPLHAAACISPILAQREYGPEEASVVYRRCGDEYMLVEYGPMALDLRLRLRAHALMTWLQQSKVSGIVDLTPGIRSLQIHFDGAKLSQSRLLEVLVRAEAELQREPVREVASRIVHLPLSWDDPQTRLAISKYMRSVRADAPWCPSNIEFIRRVNGLASERDVYDTVFSASYLVLGLGDVYLGAPVATPLDPRHRLVTTKYNPARTWTPENAVGIGGAYLCIYGMEGPGGYQFVGRTLQIYNRFRATAVFTRDQPWLLRHFDQLRFFPVSAEELLDMRRDFLYGRCEVRIEPARFSPGEYQRFLDENAHSIESFKTKQRAAFDLERQHWVDAGHLGQAKKPRAESSFETLDAPLMSGGVQHG